MQEFEEDYYAILGVEDTSGQDEIRKAYLNLAKKLHPDRHPNDPEKRAVAQREFAKVTRAHDIVGDAQRRAEYDALRALAKQRGVLAASVAAAAEATGDAEADSDNESLVTQVQATQPVADENINIKWANKHLERADDLLRKKRYQEAETAAKEAVRLVPTEAKYHNKLAEIYLARGWRTLAMTEVQSALRNDPRDPEARTLEAKIKALTRDMPKPKGAQGAGGKKSFLEQLKEILTKKL